MELLPREYFMWFCLLSIGVFGFFITTDLFTMFMFYESALIPMYLLIGVWGTGWFGPAARRDIGYLFQFGSDKHEHS